MNERDRKTLLNLLDYMDTTLESIRQKVAAEDSVAQAVPTVDMGQAWTHARTQLAKARALIASAKLKDALSRKLDDVGLTGPSLSFKMRVFSGLFSWWKGEKLFKKVLSALNKFLESLAFAVPVEAVKEFKEWLEEVIDWLPKDRKKDWILFPPAFLSPTRG